MVWEILEGMQNYADEILMAELLILVICGVIRVHMSAKLNKRMLSVTKKAERYLAVVMETEGAEMEAPKEHEVQAECSTDLTDSEEQNRLIRDVLQEIFP